MVQMNHCPAMKNHNLKEVPQKNHKVMKKNYSKIHMKRYSFLKMIIYNWLNLQTHWVVRPMMRSLHLNNLTKNIIRWKLFRVKRQKWAKIKMLKWATSFLEKMWKEWERRIKEKRIKSKWMNIMPCN